MVFRQYRPDYIADHGRRSPEFQLRILRLSPAGGTEFRHRLTSLENNDPFARLSHTVEDRQTAGLEVGCVDRLHMTSLGDWSFEVKAFGTLRPPPPSPTLIPRPRARTHRPDPPATPARTGRQPCPPNAFTRRSFLRSTGTSVLLGAAGAPALLHARPAAATPTGQPAAAVPHPAHPPSDFDEVYDRRGTESVRWDRAIERYGPGIVAAMGCRRHGLPRRPLHHRGPRRALRPRELGLHAPSRLLRRGGRGLEPPPLRRPRSTPSTLVFTTGVHPPHHRGAADLLAARHPRPHDDAHLRRLLRRPEVRAHRPRRLRDDCRRRRPLLGRLRRLRTARAALQLRSSSATRRTRPAITGPARSSPASARSASSTAWSCSPTRSTATSCRRATGTFHSPPSTPRSSPTA